jgi:lactosylceramide 4-alpha-galactosyltransferase
LNKFGGYYFDLDVLIVKSVIDYRNFVAVESKNDMGSGVIHADMGSPLMKLSVKDFADNYR